MNIGVNRLPALMDTIAYRHGEDVEEALDRFDEARKKLDEKRAERQAHLRSINEELNPPPASVAQSTVQNAADWSKTINTASTIAMIVALSLTSSFTPAAGLVVVHAVFDNIGGYEWIKGLAKQQFGLEEQTARTIVAGVRTAAYIASIGHGLSKAFSAASGGWTTLKTGFQQSTATSLFNKCHDALQAASTGSVWSQSLKIGGAIAGSTGFVAQQEQLKAHRETTKGQRSQARSLEINQTVKDAQEGVAAPAKRIQALRGEEGALDRSYQAIAAAFDVSLSGG